MICSVNNLNFLTKKFKKFKNTLFLVEIFYSIGIFFTFAT